jgi:hypothetical protein
VLFLLANGWGGNGIIFYVKNGIGLLEHGYGANEDEGLHTLTYNI